MKKAISMLLVLVLLLMMMTICAAGAMAESVSSKTTNDTTSSSAAIEVIATSDAAGTSEERAIEAANDCADRLFQAAQTADGDAQQLTRSITEIIGNVQSLEQQRTTVEALPEFSAEEALTVDVVVPAQVTSGTGTISDQTRTYTSDDKFVVLFQADGSELFIQLEAEIGADGNIVVKIPDDLNGVFGVIVVVSAK